MTRLRYFQNSYCDDPRPCERTEDVVRYWFDRSAVYEVEPDVSDKTCRQIVAERVLVRSLLGLADLEKEHAQLVRAECPWGFDGPLLAELLETSVFAAMALVPLTPLGESGHPVLSRLYCVRGLSKRFFPVELDANDLDSGRGYAWFLTGLDEEDAGKRIEGRSWLLAAELLRRVVEKRDRETARHLMAKYIVTGDVNGDRITKVEMGRKSELGHKRVFADLKWIVPKENEIMDIAKRKVEMPETLDEAQALIESMRSIATKSLFTALDHANLEEVKRQYKNGADIYAVNEEGYTPIQVVTRAMNAEIDAMKDELGKVKKDGCAVTWSPSSRFIDLSSIVHWLRATGADCSLMFYLLAKAGRAEALQCAAAEYPINAIDNCGFTAVDWALAHKNWEAAKLLRSVGGALNPRYRQNGQIADALDAIANCSDLASYRDKDRGWHLIAHAISDCGMSPDAEVELKHYFNLFDFEGRANDIPVYCSLWGCAVLCMNFEAMEACLRAGADPFKEIVYERDDFSPWDDHFRMEVCKISVREKVLSLISQGDEPFDLKGNLIPGVSPSDKDLSRIVDLLKQYGVKFE